MLYGANIIILLLEKKLLDIGVFRGYQTCFLAKEYGVMAVGIDPWDSYNDGKPHIDYLMENARNLNIDNRIIGIKVGVPDTLLASNSFDYVYSTTTLEMIRGMDGKEKYLGCLKEAYRVLKPGGIFGLGDPMHFDVEIPEDEKPYMLEEFERCFATVDDTKKAIESVGFQILEAGYVNEAKAWWEEYAKYHLINRGVEEKKLIEVDNGRWLSFGYVIAQK